MNPIDKAEIIPSFGLPFPFTEGLEGMSHMFTLEENIFNSDSEVVTGSIEIDGQEFFSYFNLLDSGISGEKLYLKHRSGSLPCYRIRHQIYATVKGKSEDDSKLSVMAKPVNNERKIMVDDEYRDHFKVSEAFIRNPKEMENAFFATKELEALGLLSDNIPNGPSQSDTTKRVLPSLPTKDDSITFVKHIGSVLDIITKKIGDKRGEDALEIVREFLSRNTYDFLKPGWLTPAMFPNVTTDIMVTIRGHLAQKILEENGYPKLSHNEIKAVRPNRK